MKVMMKGERTVSQSSRFLIVLLDSSYGLSYWGGGYHQVKDKIDTINDSKKKDFVNRFSVYNVNK